MLELEDRDISMLRGDEGHSRQLAMEIIVELGKALDAPCLVDIASVHIDGCVYAGRAGLEFTELLSQGGAQVKVPTTLNVGLLDLLRPRLWAGSLDTANAARRLMTLYVAMGCQPTFTCAPYQLPKRPLFGSHIAWAESNAIAFANSVLGARTERYGDSFDILAALTGRVPNTGLHVTKNRRAEIVFRLQDIPKRLLAEDVFFQVLGYYVGFRAEALVPAITGIPQSVTEDQMKAFGAAAASSGSIALFHFIGATPEALTIDSALQGAKGVPEIFVTMQDIIRTKDSLISDNLGQLSAVSIGTPHFSITEFDALRTLLDSRSIHPSIAFYVTTGRYVREQIQSLGWLSELELAGVQIVTDTCLYFAPLVNFRGDTVLTNSAKWAHYGPDHQGVKVAFGSLAQCVESAIVGKLVLDADLWLDVHS